MSDRLFDLAIIGAGPAGASLAIRAARGGAAVLLVDRSRLEAPRIGETAPPELRRAATTLGIADLLEDGDIARPAPAIVSVWGDDEPLERHHILSAHGDAVHLDRHAFDRALAERAAEAGAVLQLGRRASITPVGADGYRIEFGDGESVSAAFVALAVGRCSGDAGLQLKRVALDDHISLVAFLRGVADDQRTMVEAVPAGWFYAAGLPGDRTVVALTTRIAQLPASRSARQQFWHAALKRTLLIAPAIEGLEIQESIIVSNSRAAMARRVGGQRWCALGDARFAPDPLSGQGLLSAFKDATCVAEHLLDSDLDNIAYRLRERSRSDFETHRTTSASVYGLERRFSREPFWTAGTPSLRG